MVSTRKKRQSSRKLLNQLDDFDQDMIIGNSSSARGENVVFNDVLMTEILPLVPLIMIHLLMEMQ